MMILPELLDMSCVFLPQESPFLNLAILPSCPGFVIGYPTYAQTAALAPTTLTTTLATNVPHTQLQPAHRLSLTAQPPPPPPPTGVTASPPFRPNLPLLAGATVITSSHSSHRTAVTAGPTFHTNGSRGTFHGKRGQGFRGGFHKQGFRPGFKRKIEEVEENSDTSDPLNDLMQPLFCKLCKVVLNAPAQAKQHYEGKNHIRKVKMFMEGKEDDDAAQDSQVSSTTNGQPHSPNSNSISPITTPEPIDPEIYCKTCGVSFNSTKQAQQHYQGKNHAKRVRATQTDVQTNGKKFGGGATQLLKKGSKYCCEICNVSVSTKEQLDGHYQGAKHAAQVTLLDRASKALKGRWGAGAAKFTGGGVTIPTVNCGSRSSNFRNSISHSGPPPAKKTRGDFSNYRLPSGKFYCSMCNLTVGSEIAMAQHVDSRKHRSAIATKKTEEMAEEAAQS